MPGARPLFAIWKRPTLAWSMVVLLTLFGYPISAGPVLWLLFNGYLPSQMAPAIMVLYMPLAIAELSSEWFKTALEWYMEFWIKKS